MQCSDEKSVNLSITNNNDEKPRTSDDQNPINIVEMTIDKDGTTKDLITNDDKRDSSEIEAIVVDHNPK